MNPPRLGILLSGSGRTLQNLIDRIAHGRLTAQIAVVISDKRNSRLDCNARLRQASRIFTYAMQRRSGKRCANTKSTSCACAVT